MARFVIEVSNAKRNGPAYVHPGELVDVGGVKQVRTAATGILVLYPSTDADATRVQLTAQQFRDYSYEIEGKCEGKYGCSKEIKLHATNPDTGERIEVSYAEAVDIIANGLNDDSAALADQAKQDAEIQKIADDMKDEDEPK